MIYAFAGLIAHASSDRSDSAKRKVRMTVAAIAGAVVLIVSMIWDWQLRPKLAIEQLKAEAGVILMPRGIGAEIWVAKDRNTVIPVDLLLRIDITNMHLSAAVPVEGIFAEVKSDSGWIQLHHIRVDGTTNIVLLGPLHAAFPVRVLPGDFGSSEKIVGGIWLRQLAK